MPRYKLEGYNSGGYRSFREVEFEGKLEYVNYYDAEDPMKRIQYIEVTHPDGSVTQEDDDFIQALLDAQSYIESFLVIGIEEIVE